MGEGEQMMVRHIFLAWREWSNNRKGRKLEYFRQKKRLQMFRGTKIHEKMKLWYRRACFFGLERGEGLSYNHQIKKQLERQLDRVAVELPTHIALQTRRECLPIVEAMVSSYQKQLGAKNPLAIRASEYHLQLRRMLGEKEKTRDKSVTSTKY